MNLKKVGDFLFGRKANLPVPVKSGSTSKPVVTSGATARLTDTQYFDAYFSPVVARAGVRTTYSDLTEEMLNQLPPDQVRKIIRGASPIVAAAIAQFEDWVASGYTFTADYTMEDASDTPAQRLLDEFFEMQDRDYHGVEGFLRTISRDMFTHGASFSELVFDKDKRTPLKLKALDSTTAVFRKSVDPKIGEFYELGQDWSWTGGKGQPRRRGRPRKTLVGSSGYLNFVSLHGDPRIKYKPLQSESNYPYGVPVLDPAVFHVVAAAGFFNAFRQAITSNIWPSMLLGIDKEKFKQFAGATADPKALEDKLNALAKDIVGKLKKLKPGGALVFGDEVQISGSLTGQARANFGGMLKDIQDILRREMIVAVQSQPILMGSNESVAETHANLQLVSYGKLIRKAQKILNPLMTDYANLILAVNGYPQLAQFRLNYQNTAEYRDQSMTFKQFREGLQSASADVKEFVEALTMTVEAGFMTQEQAQTAFDEGMDLRRELDILPREL